MTNVIEYRHFRILQRLKRSLDFMKTVDATGYKRAIDKETAYFNRLAQKG